MILIIILDFEKFANESMRKWIVGMGFFRYDGLVDTEPS